MTPKGRPRRSLASDAKGDRAVIEVPLNIVQLASAWTSYAATAFFGAVRAREALLLAPTVAAWRSAFGYSWAVRRSLPAQLALPGVVALAALTSLWRLGSSSLFVDETFSWRAAQGSFAGVFTNVRVTEVAPPGYYILLHFWMRLVGSDSELTMRLLSALAGIAFVGVVWWLGRLVGGTAVALLASLMAALSPLFVAYAQEVRGYIFVMVCVVIAVAAAIESTRRPDEARRWIGVSAAASVATIWLNYTGLLVIFPLAWFVWTSRELGVVARRAYVAACATAFVIITPLMVIQLRAGHQGGVAPFGKPTPANFARVLGTPFDGRFPPQVLTYITGAAVAVAALAYLVLRPRVLPRARERWLLLGAALTPILAIAGVTVVAKVLDQPTYYSLITRYTAVAVAFILVAIAVALVRSPRYAAIVLAALVAVSIVSGLSATYSSANYQPDLRSAFARIARGYRSGDTIVLAGYASGHDADYYVAGLHRKLPRAAVVHANQVPATLPTSGLRLWVVSDTGSAPIVAALAQGGWHAVSSVAFNPGIDLTLATH
jgi:hypothetical protein